MSQTVPHAVVSPDGALAVLSQAEANELCALRQGELYPLFRRCALAVMTSGAESDDPRALLETYADFDLELQQVDRGLRLHLRHAPARAFVDGVMIRGIQQHLFAVLRDIAYLRGSGGMRPCFDPGEPADITDGIFHHLRQAGLFRPEVTRPLVVCWGGHSINRTEYDYCKDVGYRLGLRGMDICTGCGPGAMKGPMKGAAIAHAKQRVADGRYIGVTEPSIIAAEAPNPIVNDLVIMPDIEKRLEAFVRLAHGILLFPGGVGTAEEFFYLLGVLAHPDNTDIPVPVILTGPACSAEYFALLERFISRVFGNSLAGRYELMIDQPEEVASRMKRASEGVLTHRARSDDAAYFNWLVRVAPELQSPFRATHDEMASLVLSRELPPHELAANLRRAFSGLVAGNVKEEGIRAVESQGPYRLSCADRVLMQELDALLRAFVAQGRMRLPGFEYTPCYTLD